VQTYKRTANSSQVVATADMKLSLGVEATFTDHDTMIARMITSAQHEVEAYLRRTLLTTTWQVTQGDFNDPIMLKYLPIAEINSVKYYNGSNVLTTVDASNYFLSEDSKVVFIEGFTFPQTYDRPDAIVISFDAGVETITDTRPIEYVYFRVAEMYDNPMDESIKRNMTTKAKSYLSAMRLKEF
jgi:uncharacterized phiE125 gp8 family phage protein